MVSVMWLTACGGPPRAYRELSTAYDSTSFTLHPLDDGEELFEPEGELALADVTAAVVARNPSVELARQGWRAALAQYPQATSFADPMLGATLAPLSIFDSDVRLGYGVELSQQLPFPGKRRLRGEVALAEADAARDDYRAVRQRLALMAAHLYYDYYLVHVAIAINDEHIALLEEYGDTIARYLDTGRASQDDALKVDVDLAELHKQKLVLETDRDVVVAQLNALLHRRQGATLPAPPHELAEPPPLVAPREQLAEDAVRARPELGAAASRERGAAAGVDLAEREYYPDFKVMGTYNRMWPMLSHQIMVGVGINLPFQRRRRAAAVDAAEARVARARADRARVADDVRHEVERAYLRTRQADDTAALYRERVVVSAEDRVAAIRIGLDAGRSSFIEVLRAERELRTVRLRYHMAVADAYRGRVDLAWAIGAPIALRIDTADDGGSR